MTTRSILSLRDVSVRFGGLVAANKVTLSVNEGVIGAVIGPNGAGKTTVFNCITGIYSPTSGSVTVHDADIRQRYTTRDAVGTALLSCLVGGCVTVAYNIQALWDASINQLFIFGSSFDWGISGRAFVDTLASLPLADTLIVFLVATAAAVASSLTLWMRSRHTPHSTVERGIARTFQNIRLFKTMSVLDNVLVGMHRHVRTGLISAVLRTHRYCNEEAQRIARARELLRFVGLEEHEETLATALPYGHQRRLEIARALATSPQLLLLDEPAAGMNGTEIADLMTLIERVRESGITVLLIEHHMKLVMGISHHITVLEYGQKIAEGPPSAIRDHPRVIAAYLGESTHEQ